MALSPGLTKWIIAALGSAAGSLCAVRVSPAQNWKDAVERILIGILFTSCLCPIAVRFVSHWINIGPDSLIDLTWGVSCVLGVCSWWILHGLVAVVKRDSETTIAAIAAKLRSPKPPPPPSEP